MLVRIPQLGFSLKDWLAWVYCGAAVCPTIRQLFVLVTGEHLPATQPHLHSHVYTAAST
jgi:hypothetical protein